MQNYRQLFSIPEFRVLFAANSLNVAASSVASLALGTLTYAQTGSPVLSAFVMFGGPLVRLVSSWFLLSLADLLRPRTALMVAVGVMAGGNLLQAIPGSAIGLRLVLLMVPWIILSATSGTFGALLSDVVPEGGFVFARATSNVSSGAMQIVGFSLGGVLLLHFSPTELFAGSAGTNLLVLLLCRWGLSDRSPRAQGKAVRRSRTVNRLLIGSPVLRPVYLALWLPNGLIVGCEALIVPYSGARAGFLFSATALGMLIGDVGMGRFVPPAFRDRLVEPARLLLAAPYLVFLTQPSLGLACLLAAVASIGYSASLPLQERLVSWTAADIRGQVLGLYAVGTSSMQGVGAVMAGDLASLLGGDRHAAGLGIGLAATASFLVTVSLIPGLRRSRQNRPVIKVGITPYEDKPTETAHTERRTSADA
ncbi:MFS transporter [Kribbella capetownensis]|uniref:MFS transporter n=1 Tax=Kribbella capetownensis TaxID=1572659 RepID=UPI00192D5F75|nr:MFS transporter [Kribbella capetownensis]